jgi:hypothetical protein
MIEQVPLFQNRAFFEKYPLLGSAGRDALRFICKIVQFWTARLSPRY